MQGTATTKANPVNFFWLQTPEDLIACMAAVGGPGLGYSSILTSTVGADGQIVWSLTMNNPAQPGVEAILGQVVVWDKRQLTIYPDSDSFLALHDLTP